MLLCLKIKPNQRFDKIERLENQWIVRLKAPAVEGKANDHLVGYLSGILGIPKSGIRIKKGLTSRIKYLEIDGDENIIRRLLEAECGLHRTV